MPSLGESGKTKLKARIKGGRKAIRSALYMAAITASRCNPAMKPFYDRLVRNGKPKKVAITAVMRKMISVLNNIVKYKRPWIDDFDEKCLTS